MPLNHDADYVGKLKTLLITHNYVALCTLHHRAQTYVLSCAIYHTRMQYCASRRLLHTDASLCRPVVALLCIRIAFTSVYVVGNMRLAEIPNLALTTLNVV